MTNRHTTAGNGRYVCGRGTCFGPQKSLPEALNHGQRETIAQTIDKKLEEMIGRLPLPPVVSTGFLHVMDATGRRYTVPMDMAHSFEVCSCIRYDIIFVLRSLEFSAIYQSSSSFVFARRASK